MSDLAMYEDHCHIKPTIDTFACGNLMQPIIGAAPAATAVKEVTTATFMDEVIDASHDGPIVVDFWATWCGPCKTLGPQLEKAVAETKGAVRMVKVDVDRNQELAAQMRIQSIPAVYAFLDGRPVDGFVGAVPESQIKAFVAKLAQVGGKGPSPIDEALEQAQAALTDGDIQTAHTFYSHILQREPDNLKALIGLGRVYLALGDAEKARQVLDSLSEEQAKSAEVQALRTGIELAEQAAGASASGTQEFEIRLAKDPNDHEARYDLAMARYAAGDREGAVGDLLDIVKRNRTWNEEAARKQLVKFFEAFGFSDPLSVDGRRRLSTILFS